VLVGIRELRDSFGPGTAAIRLVALEERVGCGNLVRQTASAREVDAPALKLDEEEHV
jgi:hypothetical protein